jgi:hypothetical protein
MNITTAMIGKILMMEHLVFIASTVGETQDWKNGNACSHFFKNLAFLLPPVAIGWSSWLVIWCRVENCKSSNHFWARQFYSEI